MEEDKDVKDENILRCTLIKILITRLFLLLFFHPCSQIKYTGFRDRPHEERQARFQNACRDGRSEIVSTRTGHFPLTLASLLIT